MKRTNFNYYKATIAEIAEYFNTCTSQCISSARKRYKDNIELHSKVEMAFKQYKINKIIGA